MSEYPEVFKAICKVQEGFAKIGVAKDRKAPFGQGYAYRGIDDIVQVMAGLLPDAGLVIVPEVLSRDVAVRESEKGKSMFHVCLKVAYRFYSIVDGSSVDAVTYGEALDTSDKATNKAMSAAYKYALLQTFAIPLEGEEQDTETQNHTVKASAKPSADVEEAKAQLHDGRLIGMSGLAEAWRLLPETMKKNKAVADYKDKLKVELEA